MKIAINPSTLLTLSTLVLLTLQKTQSMDNDRPKPGDPCTVDTDCDLSQTFLECPPSTKSCRCQDPRLSYFDEGDGKCHKFVDEPCTPSEMPCPLNGGCSLVKTPSTCTCLQAYGFHVTRSKKCAKNYGQPCTESSQCDRDSFHICGEEANQSCACDETTSIFDIVTSTCVLKIGAECQAPMSPFSSTEQLEDVENDENFGGDGGGNAAAAAAPANDESPIQPCEKWTECKENYDGRGPSMTCQCVSGLVDNGEGECRTELGGSCGSAVAPDTDAPPPCNEANYLECDEMEERCECKPGLVDNENGQCRVAELGGECGSGLLCNELNFMECNSDSNQCQCRAGLTANTNEECRATENKPCDPNDLPCDEGGGLVCSKTKKVCICQSEMRENGKCVAGFVCHATGSFGDPSDCSLYHSCQFNEAGDFWDTIVNCPEQMVWCQAAMDCREQDVCPCP